MKKMTTKLRKLSILKDRHFLTKTRLSGRLWSPRAYILADVIYMAVYGVLLDTFAHNSARTDLIRNPESPSRPWFLLASFMAHAIPYVDVFFAHLLRFVGLLPGELFCSTLCQNTCSTLILILYHQKLSY